MLSKFPSLLWKNNMPQFDFVCLSPPYFLGVALNFFVFSYTAVLFHILCLILRVRILYLLRLLVMSVFLKLKLLLCFFTLILSPTFPTTLLSSFSVSSFIYGRVWYMWICQNHLVSSKYTGKKSAKARVWRSSSRLQWELVKNLHKQVRWEHTCPRTWV